MNEIYLFDGFVSKKNMFETWLDVKKLIEQNTEKKNLICSILNNETGIDYLLGKGEMHSVYSLGPIIYDEKPLHLALRTTSTNFLDQPRIVTYRDEDLQNEIARFDEANEEIRNGTYAKNNPNIKSPSLAGIITMYTYLKKSNKLITKQAILTEDLTYGRQIKLNTESGDETAQMILPQNNYVIGDCFIDPGKAKDLTRAKKYYENQLAITNLNKKK